MIRLLLLLAGLILLLTSPILLLARLIGLLLLRARLIRLLLLLAGLILLLTNPVLLLARGVLLLAGLIGLLLLCARLIRLLLLRLCLILLLLTSPVLLLTRGILLLACLIGLLLLLARGVLLLTRLICLLLLRPRLIRLLLLLARLILLLLRVAAIGSGHGWGRRAAIAACSPVIEGARRLIAAGAFGAPVILILGFMRRVIAAPVILLVLLPEPVGALIRQHRLLRRPVGGIDGLALALQRRAIQRDGPRQNAPGIVAALVPVLIRRPTHREPA